MVIIFIHPQINKSIRMLTWTIIIVLLTISSFTLGLTNLPRLINIRNLPGNQEDGKEAVAVQATAQATQQYPNLWSSAPKFDTKYSTQYCLSIELRK